MKKAFFAIVLALVPSVAIAQFGKINSSGGSGGSGGGGGATVVATTAALPATPTDGMLVYVASVNKMIIYNATAAKWYWADGTGAFKADYTLNITAAALTPPAATAAIAAGGSVTDGTHRCAVALYNQSGGMTMVGAVSADVTAGGANKTIVVSFTPGGTNVRGARAFCSKANTTSPLFSAGMVDDATTGSITVTAADSSFWFNEPDVDFSRPLPTGWVVHAPSVDGRGCGGTATNSIVCFNGWPNDPGTGTSDPRAVYVYGAGAPDNWTASWKVKRVETGFSGMSQVTANNKVLLGAVFADPTVASTAGVGAALGLSMPVSATNYVRLWRASRAAGAAWTNQEVYTNGTAIVGSPTTEWYMMAARRKDGTGDNYWFGMSSDRRAWDFPTSDGTTQCVRAGKYCAAVEMTAVGISTERTEIGYQGYLIEISDFTWNPE